MGPLRLLDEIGFDVARHAGREMAAAFGERMRPSGILDGMIEDGRLGRKNGLGFHRYEDGKDRGADPTVMSLVGVPGHRRPGTGCAAARPPRESSDDACTRW